LLIYAITGYRNARSEYCKGVMGKYTFGEGTTTVKDYATYATTISSDKRINVPTHRDP
jgi:hypothetical protein